MKWFLVILFLTPDGDPTIRDGLYPIKQTDGAVCTLRATDAKIYFQHIGKHNAQVTCELAEDGIQAIAEAMK